MSYDENKMKFPLNSVISAKCQWKGSRKMCCPWNLSFLQKSHAPEDSQTVDNAWLWELVLCDTYKNVVIKVRPISQILQCIRQIPHDAPFCNRNEQICTFLLEKWCRTGALWDLCHRSMMIILNTRLEINMVAGGTCTWVLHLYFRKDQNSMVNARKT